MITLYEGIKFRRQATPYVYTLEELKDDTLVLYAYNELNGKGQIVVMSEEYFNECDKLGCWIEIEEK